MPSMLTQKKRPRYLKVCVKTPARLHMGFMDLNGALGRRFGSLGLTLEGAGTQLAAEVAESVSVVGPQARRAESCLRQLQREFDLPGGLRVVIKQAIPEHVGLGSGTQLSLAVGAAVSRMFGLDLDLRDMAARFDRGGRSGIGIGAFEQGGFLLDGGKGETDDPPRIITRMAFPSSWRILLIFDRRGQGVHGYQELAAFRELPEFPEAAAARLCRLVLMRALPGLAEHDVHRFGAAIGEIQRVVGDYFAPAQGGRFASAAVAEALGWLESAGIAGIGQSSWGPTGFAVIESETRAYGLLRELKSRWGEDGALRFMVCRARNRGGEVDAVEADLSSAAARVRGFK